MIDIEVTQKKAAIGVLDRSGNLHIYQDSNNAYDPAYVVINDGPGEFGIFSRGSVPTPHECLKVYGGKLVRIKKIIVEEVNP